VPDAISAVKLNLSIITVKMTQEHHLQYKKQRVTYND